MHAFIVHMYTCVYINIQIYINILHYTIYTDRQMALESRSQARFPLDPSANDLM